MHSVKKYIFYTYICILLCIILIMRISINFLAECLMFIIMPYVSWHIFREELNPLMKDLYFWISGFVCKISLVRVLISGVIFWQKNDYMRSRKTLRMKYDFFLYKIYISCASDCMPINLRLHISTCQCQYKLIYRFIIPICPILFRVLTLTSLDKEDWWKEKILTARI